MPPAEQTANKNKISWWSHVKRMAPTASQSKAEKHSWSSQKDDDRGEGHEIAGSLGRWCTETVQGDGIPDDRRKQLGEG